jgi:hypothetical protein
MDAGFIYPRLRSSVVELVDSPVDLVERELDAGRGPTAALELRLVNYFGADLGGLSEREIDAGFIYPRIRPSLWTDSPGALAERELDAGFGSSLTLEWRLVDFFGAGLGDLTESEIDAGFTSG